MTLLADSERDVDRDLWVAADTAWKFLYALAMIAWLVLFAVLPAARWYLLAGMGGFVVAGIAATLGVKIDRKLGKL